MFVYSISLSNNYYVGNNRPLEAYASAQRSAGGQRNLGIIILATQLEQPVGEPDPDELSKLFVEALNNEFRTNLASDPLFINDLGLGQLTAARIVFEQDPRLKEAKEYKNYLSVIKELMEDTPSKMDILEEVAQKRLGRTLQPNGILQMINRE